jgi:hypothetical protein
MDELTAAQIRQREQEAAEAARRAEEALREAERARIRSEGKQLANETRVSLSEIDTIAAEIHTEYQGIWSSQAADRVTNKTSLAQQTAAGLDNI